MKTFTFRCNLDREPHDVLMLRIHILKIACVGDRWANFMSSEI